MRLFLNLIFMSANHTPSEITYTDQVVDHDVPKAARIVFERCVVPFETDPSVFTCEKVREAVEAALNNTHPVNEGRDYAFLNAVVERA